MKLLMRITCGKAVVVDGGLRCAASVKKGDKVRPCHRLLCKLNQLGQAAGDYLCDRCGQQIVVELAPAQ